MWVGVTLCVCELRVCVVPAQLSFSPDCYVSTRSAVNQFTVFIDTLFCIHEHLNWSGCRHAPSGFSKERCFPHRDVDGDYSFLQSPLYVALIWLQVFEKQHLVNGSGYNGRPVWRISSTQWNKAVAIMINIFNSTLDITPN